MLEVLVGGALATAFHIVGSSVKAAAGTQPVKDWLAGCKSRLIAGRALPGNHDLVRGIRTAHLCAIDAVARLHAAQVEKLPTREVDPDEQPFALDVRDFIDSRLRVTSSKAVDHQVLTIDDVDHVLDHLVHPDTAEGFAGQAEVLRRNATEHALAEIEKHAGRPAPPLFREAFEGGRGSGWYNAFALYVTEELKTNERFRAIFLAAELIDIKRTLEVQSRDLYSRFPDLHHFMNDFGHRFTEMADQIPRDVVEILKKEGYLPHVTARPSENEKPADAEQDRGDPAIPIVVKCIAKSKTLRLVYEMDENAYVDDDKMPVQNIPYALFEEWWLAFPPGFLCAFRDTRPIAVIGLFPVTEDWANDFIARKTTEFNLTASIIKRSTRKFWYFSGLSTDSLDSGLHTDFPNILGSAILEWARINLNALRTKDIMIVAEGTSPNGEHLLHDLFRFDLRSTARQAGEYPRFSKKTNLPAVKKLLLQDRYFKKCKSLHREVATQLSEISFE